MSSPTEQIKENLSIVDVVGSYIKLERAGVNYRARCPFHSERTPSFFVSPTRNSYYCFGCGAKGDIFTFVQQFEGVDFKGALQILAERAGVEIKAEDPQKKDERDKLYSVLEAACIFFQNELSKEKQAKQYLHSRGIAASTIEKWRLGFAPAQWRDLYEHLRSQNFSDEDMLGAGLVKKSRSGDRIYDTFRSRIMFPILDSAGRVIAFSGRLFERAGEEQKEGDKPPKYVNTPETVLFNKSQILYGFDKAKHSIRSHNFTIVVEGQIDLLMSHQTEFSNTVAISGTALTLDQLRRLNRLSGNVVLAFDADEAGIVSAGRSALRGLSLGMDVKVASLPDDSDPADLIFEDTDKWRKVIRESMHIVDFYLLLIEQEDLEDRKYRLEISRRVLPYIAAIQNQIDQSHFIARIASKLNVGEEVIREEVNKTSFETPPDEYDETGGGGSTQEAEAAGMSAAMSREDLIKRRLFSIVLWQELAEEPKVDALCLRRRLSELLGEDVSSLLEKEVGGDSEELIYEAEHLYCDYGDLEGEIEDLVADLDKELTKSLFNRKLAELKRAEQEGSEDEAQKLREECQKISNKLKENS